MPAPIGIDQNWPLDSDKRNEGISAKCPCMIGEGYAEKNHWGTEEIHGQTQDPDVLHRHL